MITVHHFMHNSVEKSRKRLGLLDLLQYARLYGHSHRWIPAATLKDVLVHFGLEALRTGDMNRVRERGLQHA